MRAERSFRLLSLVAATLLVAGWPDLTRPSAAPAPLLSPASGAVAQPEPDPTVRRARYVTVDVAALSLALERSPLARMPDVQLDLFPGRSIVAVADRFDANPDGLTWVGHADGVPMSLVTLVVGGGALTASVRLPDGIFAIQPVAGAPGLHVVSEIAQELQLPEAPPVEVELPAAEVAAAASAAMADPADVIDVMVLYTALARDDRGGTTGMLNYIDLSISETNSSYANSDITQRLRLVHAAEVAYTEVSQFSTNLTALRLGSGALAGVGALRDAYRADLVALFIHPPSPSHCGIAYVMTTVSTAFAPFGVSVTDSACGPLVFAHELGHNMGAQHDWYVNTNPRPFTYAHGFVNWNVGQRWRTIMAYNDRCTDQGFSCVRVPYWSNPGVAYVPGCASLGINCDLLRFWYFPGATMGVPGGTNASCRIDDVGAPLCDADNHRALDETAPAIANLREQASGAAR